ncbi:hypothetical protein LSTR_LSTR010957 [Laodelphax striatellus]|uniref:Uncharacterized protein n=1 Tax=Laodelphax striatellus TaxID=195883 RepID=A0A482XVP3_LAOST|nr:hypothetical protein LSTR_LSTR010957 [Laodelphax striatellus]
MKYIRFREVEKIEKRKIFQKEEEEKKKLKNYVIKDKNEKILRCKIRAAVRRTRRASLTTMTPPPHLPPPPLPPPPPLNGCQGTLRLRSMTNLSKSELLKE